MTNTKIVKISGFISQHRIVEGNYGNIVDCIDIVFPCTHGNGNLHEIASCQVVDTHPADSWLHRFEPDIRKIIRLLQAQILQSGAVLNYKRDVVQGGGILL